MDSLFDLLSCIDSGLDEDLYNQIYSDVPDKNFRFAYKVLLDDLVDLYSTSPDSAVMSLILRSMCVAFNPQLFLRADFDLDSNDLKELE